MEKKEDCKERGVQLDVVMADLRKMARRYEKKGICPNCFTEALGRAYYVILVNAFGADDALALANKSALRWIKGDELIK